MIVRGLDASGDFLFGKGKNDYKSNNDAVAQNIKTRLYSFLGDCFWAIDQGLDWWNLLGSKNQLALQLAVNATILNTEGVTGIIASSVNLSNNRKITISYTVTTVYSGLSANRTVTSLTSFVLTESGQVITTEDGQGIAGG